MRDSASLAGLTGIPLLLALMVMVPVASRRQVTPPPPAPAGDTLLTVTDLRVTRVEDFRIGRDLLAEVTEGAPWDSLRILVALLPDPDESSLDWVYDAHLAALRRALETAGYLSDRAWLPSRGDSANVSRGGRTVWRAAPDLLPGVMVFRGEAGRSTGNLALVYTVGEIPTAGVQREALRTALREARALMDTTLLLSSSDLPEAVRADTLRILGPTFSGSAPSLRAVLERENPATCRPVLVLSGSATSPAARRMLDFSAPCAPDGIGSDTDTVRFGATVHTDAEYAALVGVRLLASLGLHGDDVALLTEANTVYGAPQDSAATPTPPFIPDMLDPDTLDPDTLELRARAILDSATVITFPLNISSVRSAYQQNPQGRSDEQLFRLPGSRLPLPLEAERRPREGPPARSRLTAPMLDQVLEDMFATLRAKRVRAVGILATDVRDKLFLAEVVHRELPDVLLFTYEGNALFARRDLIGSVRGMVIASSYPLILQNALWAGGSAYVPFGVEGAAGVFNAALFHLGHPALVQQYRHPEYRDQTPSARGAQVPLWLTAVGTGELLPLLVVDPGVDPEVVAIPAGTDMNVDRNVAGRHRHEHGRPGVFESLSVVLAILQPFWLALILLPRLGQAVANLPGPTRWTWLTRARRDLDEWRTLDGLALMAALLAFFTPLGTLHGVSPPWVNSEEILFWLAVVLNVELAFTMALLGVALVRVAALRARTEVRTRRGRQRAAQLLGRPVEGSLLALVTDLSAHLLALLLAVLSFVYCLQAMDAFVRDATDYGLYRHRTLNLASGVSGLVPLLMATLAVVLLLAWHRDRRRLLHIGHAPFEPDEPAVWEIPGDERRRARPEDAEGRQGLDLLPAQFAAQAGTDAQLPHALQKPMEAIVEIRARLEVRVPGTLVAVVGAVAATTFLILYWTFDSPNFRTVENVALPGSMITWMLCIGLAVGMIDIGASLLHVGMVWRAFRRFLEGLADTPLAPAFERLPKRLRTLGRLHLFDPTSDRPGRVLAEAGHEALWKAAAKLDVKDLQSVGVTREQAEAHAGSLKGRDLARHRARSLRSLVRVARRSFENRPGQVWAGEMGKADHERADDGKAEPGESDDGKAEGGRTGAGLAEGGRTDAGKARDARGAEDGFEAWLRQVEDLLALEGARYVDWVLRNIRRLLIFLLFVMLFTTALLESMPFPYHSALTTAFMALVGVAVVSVIGMMMQLSRDEVLSRITGTEPGKMNWHGPSIANALIFIALPVLGLLGTEVDPVGRTLFGWVQDLLRVLSIR